MELTQSRFVTDDVEKLATFYSRLLGIAVPLNEYYVELPAGPVTVGFSKPRFFACPAACDGRRLRPGQSILDFRVDDVNSEYRRIAALGVGWVMAPTTQPWGSRAMIFTDPQGNLVNVYSRGGAAP